RASAPVPSIIRRWVRTTVGASTRMNCCRSAVEACASETNAIPTKRRKAVTIFIGLRDEYQFQRIRDWLEMIPFDVLCYPRALCKDALRRGVALQYATTQSSVQEMAQRRSF